MDNDSNARQMMFEDAIKRDNVAAVKNLLESKIDPKAYHVINDVTFIQNRNAFAITQLLLDYHADPNGTTNTRGSNKLMCDASSYNKPNIVALLLEHGANVNIVPDHSWTCCARESLCDDTIGFCHHCHESNRLPNAIESRRQIYLPQLFIDCRTETIFRVLHKTNGIVSI